MEGFINLLKPPGASSHQALSWIRRELGIKKIGHLGTLDPAAAGVLPLAVGKATKLIPRLPVQFKQYWAEVTLGAFTSTDDEEGEVLQAFPLPSLSRQELETVLAGFKGEIMQVPPRFSAIHHQGKRLYQLARNNIEVEVPPRKVEIYSLDLLDFSPPRFSMLVNCSPGTYIRALARDIGKKLSCGGYLSFLIRTASGKFLLQDSFTYEEIKEYCRLREPHKFLIPIPEVIED